MIYLKKKEEFHPLLQVGDNRFGFVENTITFTYLEKLPSVRPDVPR